MTFGITIRTNDVLEYFVWRYAFMFKEETIVKRCGYT